MSEPRVIAGDVGAVNGLAMRLRDIADLAESASSQLSGISQSNGIWAGTASDAFHRELGKLPSDLNRVQESYAKAAVAVRAYASELEGLQVSSRSAASNMADARAGRQMWESYRHDPNWDPHYVAAQIRRADEEYSSARAAGQRIHDEFEDAVNRCIAAVQAAGKAGIENSFSTFFERAAHDSVLTFTGHILKGFFVDPFVNFAHDFPDFVRHPSCSGLAKVARDVGGIAAVIGLIVAVAIVVAASGGTAVPALGAALPVLEGAANVLDLASGAAAVTAAGADVGGLATHDPGSSVSQLVDDSISVGAYGVSKYVDYRVSVRGDGANAVSYARDLQDPDAPIELHQSTKLDLRWDTHGDVHSKIFGDVFTNREFKYLVDHPDVPVGASKGWVVLHAGIGIAGDARDDLEAARDDYEQE